MSEPTVRPVWTPDDYWNTVRAAEAERGKAIAAGEPDPDSEDMLPFRRSADATCACCGAWPLEACEPGCLNLMTPEQQRSHRDDVLDRTIAELDRLEASPDVFGNLSAPAGRHRADVGPTWSWYAKTAAAVVVLVLVLTVGALWAATRANADAPGCVTQFWLIPFQSNTRTLCDGPIQADGSWLRAREFWSPAYTAAARSSCSGSYAYRSCTYYPERFVPRASSGVERYTVTPETVLHDEPGHLG